MDEYGRMGPHRHRKARMKHKLALIGMVVVVVLVAAFAYYFLGSPTNVAGTTTLTLSPQGTVFSMAGSSYVATLAGYNQNTGTAYVYITSVPVFLGPILNVTLHPNSTVKVNYNGNYAIMELTLLSASASSAKVQISPLALALDINPDYQYIGHPSVPLPGLAVTVTTTVPANSTSTNPTTTIASAGSGSTVPTTTVAASVSTTIAQQTNYTAAAIQSAAKDDPDYALVLNFTTLYDNTPNCTSNQYFNTYFQQFGTSPVPPEDYPNVSLETPHGMTQSIVSNGGAKYSLEFLPQVQDQGFAKTAALTIGLTVTGAGSSGASAVINSNSYNGIFAGLTYQELVTLYQQSKAIGNACGVMVA